MEELSLFDQGLAELTDMQHAEGAALKLPLYQALDAIIANAPKGEPREISDPVTLDALRFYAEIVDPTQMSELALTYSGLDACTLQQVQSTYQASLNQLSTMGAAAILSSYITDASANPNARCEANHVESQFLGL